MYGYIYKTTNLINGKKYIGKHISEIFEPDSYLGSGILLSKALKKYGKENFKCELLETCSSKEELDRKEKYWISYYDCVEDIDYYNLAKGGDGGIGRGFGSYWEDEDKKTIALIKQKESLNKFFKENKDIRSGKNNPMYGKHHTKETKDRISTKLKSSEKLKNSTRFKYHSHSKQSKEKIGKALRGRIWITDGNICKLVPNDTILPEGWKLGRKLSEETKNRLFKKEEYNKIIKTQGKKKKVRCIELDIVFNSIKEAVNFCGNTHVADCCYGRRNTAAGYHWEFV